MTDNILTVDVEDYYMVSAFESVVNRSSWDRFESRVERNTLHLLKILESVLPVRTPATFFCLGCVAERHPHLIREIHSRGHEVACHGYDHRRITSMSPEDFRKDIRKAKTLLEDITGQEVIGYRAPSYSIMEKTTWAMEILAEEGFLYDSSVFPIRHDMYGMSKAPRFPCIVRWNGSQTLEYLPFSGNGGNGSEPCSRADKHPASSPREADLNRKPASFRNILEFPLSTLRLFGQNIPVAGGGYFRLLPIRATQWALRQISEIEGLPFIFYIHPWELDPCQPRIRGASFKARFRHYHNLSRTEGRLRKLLKSAPFSSFQNYLNRGQ